jgi:hypothetical protein
VRERYREGERERERAYVVELKGLRSIRGCIEDIERTKKSTLR